MASLPQSSPTPSMSISHSFHLTFLDALVAESVPTRPFSIPKKGIYSFIIPRVVCGPLLPFTGCS